MEKQGWDARYQALAPSGELISLHEWFEKNTQAQQTDQVNRLNNLVSPVVGDLLLISNYDDGFYFSAPTTGVHGGLHPDDSFATFFFGWPQENKDKWNAVRSNIKQAVEKRCLKEGDRKPSTTDLSTVIYAVLGIE